MIQVKGMIRTVGAMIRNRLFMITVTGRIRKAGLRLRITIRRIRSRRG
nr:MAG TPA: hypothetical protein [Caudoviricetes sp.]